MTRINIFISANNSKNNSIRFFLPFQQWEKEERERENEHSIIQTLVQNSLYCKTHISDECGRRKSKSYLKICIDFLLLNPLQFPTREFNNPSDKSNSIHNPLILFSLFSFFFFSSSKKYDKNIEGEYSIVRRRKINRRRVSKMILFSDYTHWTKRGDAG